MTWTDMGSAFTFLSICMAEKKDYAKGSSKGTEMRNNNRRVGKKDEKKNA